MPLVFIYHVDHVEVVPVPNIYIYVLKSHYDGI